MPIHFLIRSTAMPKPRKKLSKQLSSSVAKPAARGDVLKWKRMGPKQAGAGKGSESGVGQAQVAMNLNKKRREFLFWDL